MYLYAQEEIARETGAPSKGVRCSCRDLRTGDQQMPATLRRDDPSIVCEFGKSKNAPCCMAPSNVNLTSLWCVVVQRVREAYSLVTSIFSTSPPTLPVSGTS